MEKISLDDCKVKARSKKEVYDLLMVQRNYYIPPIQECNHEYIKEIIQDKARVRIVV